MTPDEIRNSAIAAVALLAVVTVFARYPTSRKWIGAAASILIGLTVAVPFVAAGALLNMDTDGSLEPGPMLAGAAAALTGLVLAVVILRRSR